METGKPPLPDAPPRVRDAGALLLAAGGLAAAFGAASCCALPLILASLGLSSAWLFGIAVFVAPHRIALLALAVACLATGGGLLIWRRRAAAGAVGGSCAASPLTAMVGAGILSLTAVLVVLGVLLA